MGLRRSGREESPEHDKKCGTVEAVKYSRLKRDNGPGETDCWRGPAQVDVRMGWRVEYGNLEKQQGRERVISRTMQTYIEVNKRESDNRGKAR